MIAAENRLTLRPLQEINCQKVTKEPATLIALPLGSGKTTVAVEAVFRERDKLKQIIVIAPRNTVLGWERTVRRQYQNYADINLFRRIDSTKSGKAAMESYWSGEPGWYFVTWEFFRTRAQHFWDKSHPDVVIADECQRMQNRDGKTWTNMRLFGKKAKRIALSGTPQGNKMHGLWTTLRWLFPEDLTSSVYTTPRSFWAWVENWLTVTVNPYLGFTEVGGERFELGTMLSYYQSYIREADLTEVPEVNVIDIHVEMTVEQKRMYKQMMTDAIAWLSTPDPTTGKRPLVTELPMSIRLRLRQITLGVPYFNAEGKVSYAEDSKSSKLDAVLEELAALPDDEPVLIFTHSREFAQMAAIRLTKAGYLSWAWVGGTTDKMRQEAVALWGKPNGPQVIVAVVEAIAEGTDGLQDMCREEIWLSESENMMMNEQARGRLPRGGQQYVVNRRRIIVPGTYDEKIIDSHLARLLESNQSLKGK